MVFPTVTDPEVLEGYLVDASNLRGHAEALLRPTSTQEVAEIVRHCQAHQIPLTITAARTSTTGAPVPMGGWLLSTERLDQVLGIDHDQAEAMAGVGLGAFQDAIEARGRLFPPDPTSRYDCTLGAAIACNASGARSFKYGPTRRWIEALEVVLPTGEVRTFRRGEPIPEDWPQLHAGHPAVKSAAGYGPAQDALDLFIGMEGTLGVITRATCRLTDGPEDVLGLLVFFEDRSVCLEAVTAWRAQARAGSGPVQPRAIEYFDAACLDLARERAGGVPDSARHALFLEQEVHATDDPDALVEAWYEAIVEAGALADDTVLAMDEAGRQRLHALRHAIPAGINEQVVRNGMPKLGTDLAVPDDALADMMDRYEAAPVRHVLFGHIGDNHLHLNMLPTSEAELAMAKAYYDDLARAAIAAGGTVSAEHGIGKVKRHQLAWMVGEDTLERFRALKRHLDPAWILGRGTLFHPR